jgi:hypothetical protein
MWYHEKCSAVWLQRLEMEYEANQRRVENTSKILLFSEAQCGTTKSLLYSGCAGEAHELMCAFLHYPYHQCRIRRDGL